VYVTPRDPVRHGHRGRASATGPNDARRAEPIIGAQLATVGGFEQRIRIERIRIEPAEDLRVGRADDPG